MDRDHRLRLAVKHLPVEQRRKALEALCALPESLRSHELRRLNAQAKYPRWTARRGAKRLHNGAKVISWNLRLTPDEWLRLRDAASKDGLSMAELVRSGLRQVGVAI